MKKKTLIPRTCAFPGLGDLRQHEEFPDRHVSELLRVPLFANGLAEFHVDNYWGDQHQEEFHLAVARFLDLQVDAFDQITKHFETYRLDSSPKGQKRGSFDSSVWQSVQFPSEIIVRRRDRGDKAVYIGLECECDWEKEHGLWIVLRNGNQFCKIGGFDGHLSNADAYGMPNMESTVYVS